MMRGKEGRNYEERFSSSIRNERSGDGYRFHGLQQRMLIYAEGLIPEKERFIRDKYGISPYDVLPYRTYNRDVIRKSEKCCCYHCKKIFDAREIDEWLERDAGQTAICPYCGETFVLGDGSGFPVSDQEFVEALNTYWFH